MTMSPAAVRTARRNLVLRIGRCIAAIGEGLQPNVDGLENLVIALDCLERGVYPTGEDAMMLAEKGWAPRRPRTIQARPMGELVQVFERLRAEG
jgi:hypothetical protein